MSYFDDNEERFTSVPSFLFNPKILAGTSQGIRKLLGIKKTMQIQILNVTKTPAKSAKGTAYEFLDIAYKNLTFQGKVEGKKLMPFGDNANAFNVLKNALVGQTYTITVQKNNAGYNDWTAATQGEVVTGDAQQTSYQPQAARPAPAPARTNTFETPEERAKKQVVITRLATVNSAIAALTPGAKAPLKVEDVTAFAKTLENYVYDIGAPAEDATGFDTMDDDIPV